jgi:hypothetical protein
MQFGKFHAQLSIWQVQSTIEKTYDTHLKVIWMYSHCKMCCGLFKTSFNVLGDGLYKIGQKESITFTPVHDIHFNMCLVCTMV